MCTYCSVRENYVVGFKSGQFLLRSNHLCIIYDEKYLNGKYYLSDNSCESIEINYCPICGRKLKEEQPG